MYLTPDFQEKTLIVFPENVFLLANHLFICCKKTLTIKMLCFHNSLT